MFTFDPSVNKVGYCYAPVDPNEKVVCVYRFTDAVFSSMFIGVPTDFSKFLLYEMSYRVALKSLYFVARA